MKKVKVKSLVGYGNSHAVKGLLFFPKMMWGYQILLTSVLLKNPMDTCTKKYRITIEEVE